MFFGFNTAVRGLVASQRGLYTTGHNIDNSSTPGYSRQLIDQGATTAHRLPGIGYIGTGTEIKSIVRSRDAFVDFKYWSEKAPTGEWSTKNDVLIELEKIMGEPSESSFRKYLDDFFESIDELSKNVSDPAFREPVRENAISFTKHINEVAKKLENMRKDSVSNLSTKVDKVNQLSDQIASLNRQIYAQELDGLHANDLRDRRELLVDELSEIIDVRVSESPNGHYDVSIGGNSLVNHFNSSKIKLNRKNLSSLEEGFKDGSLSEDDKKDLVEGLILWDNGSPVNYKSGDIKGLVDLVTGNGKSNDYRGIPFYESYLDEFAVNFAKKINDQHKKGYTLGKDGSGDYVKGGDFFSFTDPDNPSAATIKLDDKILESVDNIAAGGKTGAAEDNGNLLEIIKLREDRKFFDGGNDYPIGTPDDFIKSMLSSLAVDNLQAGRFKETQELLEQNLENKRQSISGVSLNEEMANMVKFQKVYIASSKMITTYDTLLDVTINRLGMVGR